jgi:hypothetical protein
VGRNIIAGQCTAGEKLNWSFHTFVWFVLGDARIVNEVGRVTPITGIGLVIGP